MERTSVLVGIGWFAGVLCGIVLGYYGAIWDSTDGEPFFPQSWDKAKAELLPSSYKDGMDERVYAEQLYHYEGWDCRAIMWRHRGRYFIGHVGTHCGGLVPVREFE